MELLSPAGNIEKMETAFAYGADAVYMGLKRFSLRAKAGNFGEADAARIAEIQAQYGGKAYGALNIYCGESDIDALKEQLDEIAAFPFDAFIVSDLGLAAILKKRFPDIDLHLSTQANCLNSESVKLYRSLGFNRIIMGREASVSDIKRIKDAAPDMELEAFVHGAMCMAYSGRCFLSAHLAGRSANQGDCAHACRWNYRLALEEQKRPGIYYPIAEDDGCTTILSSKDLCMIDHLADLRDAGVSSLKIEGRMKSIYYVATVTRAYRKAIDALTDPSIDFIPYRDELLNVSHREFSTGFFYGHGPIDIPAKAGYERDYLYLGKFLRQASPDIWEIDIRNQIASGRTIEYIGPDVLKIEDSSYRTLDENFNEVPHIDHCQTCYLCTKAPVKSGYLIRSIAN
ncbi:MAG: U32 family peptidase [Sphaerochaetaceae bacterium]